MTKPTKPRKPAISRRRAVPKVPPRLEFLPQPWRPHNEASPTKWIALIFANFGRFGLADEYSWQSLLRPVDRQPLGDLLMWRDDFPNEAYALLVDPFRLDLKVLAERIRDRQSHKPRIEIYLEITKKQNLTVRWQPSGFNAAYWSLERSSGRYTSNLLDGKDFDRSPDFRWFTGNEAASWNSRASNELMYIRGVGDIEIDPMDGWPTPYNCEVLSALLICAVRAGFNSMVNGLRESFEVTLLNDFSFGFAPGPDDSPNWPHGIVTGWRLTDIAQPNREASANPRDLPSADIHPFPAPGKGRS